MPPVGRAERRSINRARPPQADGAPLRATDELQGTIAHGVSIDSREVTIELPRRSSPAEAKACIAFAVACCKQSPAYRAAQLRKTLDLTDEAIVELVASVMDYVSFSTISHAMLLEPARTDMRALDFAQ